MSDLKIQLAAGRMAFDPGEELTGTAAWKLDKPPRSVELRLLWFTRGQGEEDACVVETVRFDHPIQDDSRPCSFSGKLILLVWALELVVEPSKENARQEITLAPGAKPVQLESLPETKAKKRSFPWFRR
jgi:hypothetical protein